MDNNMTRPFWRRRLLEKSEKKTAQNNCRGHYYTENRKRIRQEKKADLTPFPSLRETDLATSRDSSTGKPEIATE